MPRLSVPLTEDQHRALRLKCADLGVAQAEVARRLLAAWVRGELEWSDEKEKDAGYATERHWYY